MGEETARDKDCETRRRKETAKDRNREIDKDGFKRRRGAKYGETRLFITLAFRAVMSK